MSILHDFIVNADYTDGYVLANNIKGFAVANNLKSWEITPPVSIQPDLFKLIRDRKMPVLVKRDMFDQVTSVLCYLWNSEQGYYTAFEVLPSIDQDFESLYGFTGVSETIEDRFLRNHVSRDFVFYTPKRPDMTKAANYAFSEIIKMEGVEKCTKFDFLYIGPFVTDGVGRFIAYNGNVYAFTLSDPLLSLRTLTVHFTEGSQDIDFIYNTFAGFMNHFLSPEYVEPSAQQELEIEPVTPEVEKVAITYAGQLQKPVTPKAPEEEQAAATIDVVEHMTALGKSVAAFRGLLAKTKGR